MLRTTSKDGLRRMNTKKVAPTELKRELPGGEPRRLPVRLLGGLRTKYNVDVSLASFFKEPTVQALAAQVEKSLAAHCAKKEQGVVQK